MRPWATHWRIVLYEYSFVWNSGTGRRSHKSVLSRDIFNGAPSPQTRAPSRPLPRGIASSHVGEGVSKCRPCFGIGLPGAFKEQTEIIIATERIRRTFVELCHCINLPSNLLRAPNKMTLHSNGLFRVWTASGCIDHP